MSIFDMDPNTANNLMDFGFASMAAGGQPGATTLGALGQGGLGMNQAALQRAQTQNMQSETQSRQLQNQLFPLQYKKMQQEMDLLNSVTGETPSSAANTGMPAMPTVGTSKQPSNNPGNLRPVGSSTGFQQFPTPQAGVDAARADLLGKINGSSPVMQGRYGKDYTPSLRNVIATWAPPNENNTAAYIENVSKKTGINPNQILTAADVDKILSAMFQQEGNSNQSSANQPVDSNMRKSIAIGLINPALGAEYYKTQSAGAVAAAQEKAKADSAGDIKQKEKEGENTAEAEKTVSAIDSRIDSVKGIIKQMRDLSAKMPSGQGSDMEVGGSRMLTKVGGSGEYDKNWQKFANLNDILFTQELPGVVPAGSRLDIPIVNALQSASKVDPYSSHQARLGVLDNLEQRLTDVQDNAHKNYGILSGKEMPVAPGTVSPAAPIITHKFIPGQGIVPIGR